jgi:hypothetical protein
VQVVSVELYKDGLQVRWLDRSPRGYFEDFKKATPLRERIRDRLTGERWEEGSLYGFIDDMPFAVRDDAGTQYESQAEGGSGDSGGNAFRNGIHASSS